MQKRREQPRLKFGVVVKDKRSKKQGPNDGSGNQGQGPKDGTGYGAKSGKRGGPQDGSGPQHTPQGQGRRGGRR